MSKVATPRASMSCIWIMPMTALRSLSSSFQQNAPLLTSIWRRWGKTSCHGCKAPLLHICFDKDESRLSKVDMHSTGSVCTDCREQVLGFETMGNIFQLLAVSCEEYCASSRAISNSDNISLHELRPISWSTERLVISSMSSGCICNGILMPTCELISPGFMH